MISCSKVLATIIPINLVVGRAAVAVRTDVVLISDITGSYSAISIETAFSGLRVMLRKLANAPSTALWPRPGRLAGLFKPDECANYFTSCGQKERKPL